jgi:hypothetical protein
MMIIYMAFQEGELEFKTYAMALSKDVLIFEWDENQAVIKFTGHMR